MFLLQKIGVNRPDEDLNPDSLKTKATFGGIQLIYTIITIIPTPFLFNSYAFSCVYLMFIYSVGTWNGASYYIEVGDYL